MICVPGDTQGIAHMYLSCVFVKSCEGSGPRRLRRPARLCRKRKSPKNHGSRLRLLPKHRKVTHDR
jgi:hypothetical protein